jgi:hypothetical protein
MATAQSFRVPFKLSAPCPIATPTARFYMGEDYDEAIALPSQSESERLMDRANTLYGEAHLAQMECRGNEAQLYERQAHECRQMAEELYHREQQMEWEIERLNRTPNPPFILRDGLGTL